MGRHGQIIEGTQHSHIHLQTSRIHVQVVSRSAAQYDDKHFIRARTCKLAELLVLLVIFTRERSHRCLWQFRSHGWCTPTYHGVRTNNQAKSDAQSSAALCSPLGSVLRHWQWRINEDAWLSFIALIKTKQINCSGNMKRMETWFPILQSCSNMTGICTASNMMRTMRIDIARWNCWTRMLHSNPGN